MKNAVLKLLVDTKGRMITLATGIVAGFVTRFAVDHSWTMDPKDLDYITVAVTLFVGWAIDSLVIKIQTAGVKQIQDALPPSIISDGVAGPKTVAAVEKMADQADSPPKPTP